MKRVEVEWIDSTAVDMGWDTVAAYAEHAYPDAIHSLGYVVAEKDDCIMLAQSWKQASEHRPNENITDALVIPRADIRALRELRAR